MKKKIESLRDARIPLPQDGPCTHDCRDCVKVVGCLYDCCGWRGKSDLFVCVKPKGHTGNHGTVRLSG